MKIKNTKIICTIGPSSWNENTLKQLADEGMDLARLNFSHGIHEEKIKQIKIIRKISKELNKPIGIIADLAGPKLRLGKIRDINLKKDQIIQLCANPLKGEIPLQFNFAPYLKKGQRILLNDGAVELKVLRIKGPVITASVKNSGFISAHKGINIPDATLPLAALTQKDLEDGKLALENGVDFLALSFVQSANDLKKARQLVSQYNPRTKIIVKLEKPQAVKNLEEIIKESDAVMVARGDLAIETEASSVPLLQKQIIRLSRQYFKPVIVATQMLESMTQNPRPTRAEVSDVANAIFDQADCIMLSAESASGKYPVEAVKVMSEIIASVESHDEYRNVIGVDMNKISSKELGQKALAASSVFLADLVKSKLIVVGTVTGNSAYLVSAFRPPCPIIALTTSKITKNQLSLYWGIHPFLVPQVETVRDFWELARKFVYGKKLVSSGDNAVIISGSKMNTPLNTDTIKLINF